MSAGVRVGKSTTENFINVQGSLRLIDIKPLGIYIIFDVNKCVQAHPVEPPAENAFSLLMSHAKSRSSKIHLPDVLPEIDSKGRTLKLNALKNKFREFLVKNSVGWSEDALKKYGSSLINVVSDTLWYIDGHHETLKRQGCSIPVEFSHFQNFNTPESHGHKRKASGNLSSTNLHVYILQLSNVVACAYMRSLQWESVRVVIEKLLSALSKYHSMLEKKAQTSGMSKLRMVTTEDDEMEILGPKFSTKSNVTARYSRLVEALNLKAIFEPLCVDDFTPTDRRRRHEYLKGLVLPIRTVLYKHSSGKTNVHFLWRVDVDSTENDILNLSVKVRDDLRQSLPTYHTRAMRREFISSFGAMTGTKSAILREAYRRLTGDAAAPNCLVEKQVDERVRELLEFEDPEIIWDLRLNNKGRPELYEEFLQACRKFVDAKIETAVDDRRHDNVSEDDNGSTLSISHLAMAISVVDLHRQVSETMPEGEYALMNIIYFYSGKRNHANC